MSEHSLLDSTMSNRCWLFAVRDGNLKILALRRAQVSLETRYVAYYEPTGGSIELGMALSPGLEMIRELDEETGFDPELKFLAVIFFDENDLSIPYTGKVQHMSYHWLGRIYGDKLKLSEEHDGFKWCSLEQFDSLNLTPRTRVVFNLLRPQLEQVIAEYQRDNLANQN